MELLIYTNEVVDTAFAENDQMDYRAITNYKIKAVQLKFIEPVFGDMYRAMTEGKYKDFVEKQIKPALAYYIKYAVIPELAVKAGNSGIMRNKSTYSASAAKEEIGLLMKESKAVADSLMDKAVAYVEENITSFPEYDAEKNVRKRITLTGGLIVEKHG